MDVGDEVGEKLVKESIDLLRFMTRKAADSIPREINLPSGRNKLRSEIKIVEEDEEALTEPLTLSSLDVNVHDLEELASLQVATVQWDPDCTMFAQRLSDASIPFNYQKADGMALFTVLRQDATAVIGIVNELKANVKGFDARRFPNLAQFKESALGEVSDDKAKALESLENMVIEVPVETLELAQITSFNLECLGCPHEILTIDGDTTIVAKASDLLDVKEYIPEVETQLQDLFERDRASLIHAKDVQACFVEAKNKAKHFDPKTTPTLRTEITPKQDIAQGKAIAEIQRQEQVRKQKLTRGGR